MRLTITTFLSIDGVMQSPGGPWEDTSNGFDLGGWVPPYIDEGFGAFMDGVFAHADAFLLGRKTFEIFAAFWPDVTDPDDTVATKLNGKTKYVPTSTVAETSWANTTLVDGDLAETVTALKTEPGDELQVHGSGRLARSLHDLGLIDEYRLLTFPVVLGKGSRLFSDGAVPTEFEQVDHTMTGSGISISTLRPTGPARTGDVVIEDGAEVIKGTTG